MIGKCEKCGVLIDNTDGRCYSCEPLTANTVSYPITWNWTWGDVNKGWECPKCGRCYSPTTSMCSFCGPQEGLRTTTGG